MKWTKVIQAMTMLDGEVEYIKARSCEGLAIHRTAHNPKLWRITHVESGLRVNTRDYPSLARAKEVAEQLLSVEGFWLNDYESIDKAVAKDGIWHKRILSILECNWDKLSLDSIGKRNYYAMVK